MNLNWSKTIQNQSRINAYGTEILLNTKMVQNESNRNSSAHQDFTLIQIITLNTSWPYQQNINILLYSYQGDGCKKTQSTFNLFLLTS